MNKINNENVYLSKMRRTFTDKAWFMSLIPDDVTTIVDFGSADNSFINFLKHDYPEYRYVGIENNENFFKASVEQKQECYHSLSEFYETGDYDPETTLLVLNSVLHEVYSYGCADAFWHELLVFDAKYVAFRDMYPRNCGKFGSGAFREMESNINCSGMRDHYEDFIQRWGRVRDGYTAIHFLLKYFYDENWQRECDENYIPFHYRELYTQIRKAGYNITSEYFYSLPYLKNKWHNDFRCNENSRLKSFIDQITTHLKLFLVRELRED